MTTAGSETPYSDHSLKPRRPKSREVSSRFLSPISIPLAESRLQTPKTTLSPLRRKPRSSTNHRGNEKLKNLTVDRENNESSENSTLHNKRRSCIDLSRFEKKEKSGRRRSEKENHKLFFGGSMRESRNFRYRRRSSSTSSSNKSPDQSPVLAGDDLVPGRFSADENELRRRSFALSENSSSDTVDAESECSDICSGTSFGSSVTEKKSPASYLASTASSRKSGGIEISSKYMLDITTRRRRGRSDSVIPRGINSLETSKSALSPAMPVENKGKQMFSSSSRPPTSSSARGKGVGKNLPGVMGLDLLRSKKSTAATGSLGLGSGGAESAHQLRLVYNGLVQWRFANARADAVNGNITIQAEGKLVHAWKSLTKLQHSVLEKKLQLEKDKLEMKLNFLLHSQVKSLEAWGDMERQHLSAISMTRDCLHSVICRLPLVEGAKMEPHSSSVALRHASDLATSMKSMLYVFSPVAEKTVSILWELAEVVTQEKALLEQFSELFRMVSTLEVQEMSLKCGIIQMKLWQQQQLLQEQQEMAS